MLFFYNAGIRIYSFLIRVFSLFNRKAALWVKGRKGIFKNVAARLKSGDTHIWFHFASLGEFEQGRPVLEKIKERFPGKKILITFFSPSGYEIRKDYPLADYVCYLPLDTVANARKFINLINPEFAVFTKYDYWYHYFNELNKRKIPLYVISAIFSERYSFFRWYGFFNRRMLKLVNQIFVQDEGSKALLASIGITKVIVSGDTRFDRVNENAIQAKHLPAIETFCGSSPVFIAGSTWPLDEELLVGLISVYPHWKFIIAPHEIGESRIAGICNSFPGAIRYSSITNPPSSNILIIDNIGLLSSIYQYGTIAYIGGGFGAGIHNTLEAAAFGLPVIFGPKYQKFMEAVELIEIRAAFTISSGGELMDVMKRMEDGRWRMEAGKIAEHYVKSKIGATGIILREIFV